MKSALRDIAYDFKCRYCESAKYTFSKKNINFHVKSVGTWSKQYVVKDLNYNITKV